MSHNCRTNLLDTVNKARLLNPQLKGTEFHLSCDDNLLPDILRSSLSSAGQLHTRSNQVPALTMSPARPQSAHQGRRDAGRTLNIIGLQSQEAVLDRCRRVSICFFLVSVCTDR